MTTILQTTFLRKMGHQERFRPVFDEAMGARPPTPSTLIEIIAISFIGFVWPNGSPPMREIAIRVCRPFY
jgi:hypothetical protein